METITKICEECHRHYNVNESISDRRHTCMEQSCIDSFLAKPENYRMYAMVEDYGASFEEAEKHRNTKSCEICGKSQDDGKLVIDHCHKDGHIRGVLCYGCNTSLGKLKDSVDFLENAIKYLKER